MNSKFFRACARTVKPRGKFISKKRGYRFFGVFEKGGIFLRGQVHRMKFVVYLKFGNLSMRVRILRSFGNIFIRFQCF